MRKSGSVHVIVYYPKSEEGKLELARRVAEVHANAVQRRIQEQNCTVGQKLQLLDAVIETAKQQQSRQSEALARNRPSREQIER